MSVPDPVSTTKEIKNADLGLRQTVVHDAHETVGVHRVAHLGHELRTALWGVYVDEVDDGDGRVLDCSPTPARRGSWSVLALHVLSRRRCLLSSCVSGAHS